MRLTSGHAWQSMAIGLAALFGIIPQLSAQELPVRVTVSDNIYVVQGENITAEKTGAPLDEFTRRKASLAARVLEKQILNSAFNQRFFDPVNRASIFSDQQSDRLLEPWRRPLANAGSYSNERAIAAARAQFKSWAMKLADDPRNAALAVVRQDYRDTIDAYRDNVAIFRSVIIENKPLSYADAAEFLNNQIALARLASARAIEAQLADPSVAPPADIAASAAAGRTSHIAQRIQNEIIAKIDAAKTVADLEKANFSLRQITLAEFSSLKSYDDGIKPPVIHFAIPRINNAADARAASGVSAATPPTTLTPNVTATAPQTQPTSPPSVNATTPATSVPSTINVATPSQSGVSVTVPVSSPKSLQPFGVTGGVANPPYPGPNTAPGKSPTAPKDASNVNGAQDIAAGAKNISGRTWRSGIPEITPVGMNENLKTYSSLSYRASDGYVFRASTGLWENPANPTQTRIPSVITCCDSSGLAFPSDDANSNDNLKTFSSRPYHSTDGMVFNPANGLWQDTKDASNTRNPSVITCCDETGLAFPNEAIEAQLTYWNDGSGTDPNCNRLYKCGDPGKTDPDPQPIPDGPTDRDADITRAIGYIKSNFPPEKQDSAISSFINSLPDAYKGRGIFLRSQFDEAQKGGGTRAKAPAPRLRAPYAEQRQAMFDPNRGRRSSNSDVTGVGGSIRSHYEPITRGTAQNIIGRYKSIPGGVTLEGAGIGLPPLHKAVYLKESNAFIINDDLVYLIPVKAAEFAELDQALQQDDKLGVSLGAIQLVYGALPQRGNIALALKIADRFFGAIVFYNKRYLADYRMAPGYTARAIRGSLVAVYFNFNEYNFKYNDSGQLGRSGVGMKATLVPLRPSSGASAHMPDLDRISSGDLPSTSVANIQHLQDNFAYYAGERVIRRTMAYGEAAAFLRSLKSAGIKPELN